MQYHVSVIDCVLNSCLSRSKLVMPDITQLQVAEDAHGAYGLPVEAQLLLL